MKTIILVALPEELTIESLPPDTELVYTGIGKINAAAAAQHAIDGGATRLINLGSAGSKKFARGQVVNCTKFIQRDFDLTLFGRPLFANPIDKVAPDVILEYGRRIAKFEDAICGSGDNFADKMPTGMDVVDMEGYAIAHTAKANGVDFICLKYISDGADDKAASAWQNELDSQAALASALLSVIPTKAGIHCS